MTELIKKNKIVLIYTLLTELVIVIATGLELFFGGVAPIVMFGMVSIIITNSIICGLMFRKNKSSENFRYIAIGGFSSLTVTSPMGMHMPFSLASI